MNGGYRMFIGAALIALLWALAACDAKTRSAVAVGEAVPDFGLIDFDGRVKPISAWRGKTVMLNFWASWCAPCRDELPTLDKLSKAAGPTLMVAAVSLDDDRNLAREFLLQGGYHIVSYSDPRREIARAIFDLSVLPATVVIGPDGKLIARVSGARDWSDARQLRAVGVSAPIRRE